MSTQDQVNQLKIDCDGIVQLKKDFQATEIYLIKYQPLQVFKTVHDALMASLEKAPLAVRID
jgi:hypothetical protein